MAEWTSWMMPRILDLVPGIFITLTDRQGMNQPAVPDRNVAAVRRAALYDTQKGE